MKNKTKLTQIIQQEYSHITGMMILQKNHVQYEHYFHENHEQHHFHVYSVTKSIVSLLIGIAIDKGYIKSVRQSITDFFPEYKHTLSHITIHDMLTMLIPYQYEIPPYEEYFQSEDHVQFSLNQIDATKSVGNFMYAPLIGPDILSGILVKATGQSVLDFANKYVFEPLKIDIKRSIQFQTVQEQFAFNEANNINGWVCDGTGVHTAGWGLTLSCRDMIKIGQLYLHKGTVKETFIVSSSWIEESTQQQSYFAEMGLPYGYLWWVIQPHGFAALGDGGNVIYVNKEKELIVAITAKMMPNIKDSMEFIQTYID